MRVYEQTIRYELYSIEELQGESRQAAIDNVRELILNSRDTWDFSSMLNDYFYDFLDISSVDYDFQLDYAQGDHFNIAVKLTVEDIFNLIDRLNITVAEFTPKELRTLKFYENECDGVKIRVAETNRLIPWMLFDDMDIYDEMVYWLEYYCIRDINYDLLERFNNIVVGLVKDIERYCMERGYDYFYNVDEYDIFDYIACDGTEFLADGTIF